MKIFDSHVKEEIKKVIKGNKKPIIFGLILTAMINMGSMFALVNNNKIERKDKELRKNKFLAEILLEDPKRSIELIDKKIG